jgi:S-formylglutathione hydrolase FrmB
LFRVLLGFVAALVLAFTPTPSRAPARVGEHSTVRVLHVASADRDVVVRDVWVYRPAVRDSRNLPVVYFLHGLPGSASDFFEAGGATALDRLFASGVPPFVLVAPTGSGQAHPDTEWADSVDGRDRLETYLVDKVIPAVEGPNRRDAAHRVLAGFSMGGYGAANLALRNANLFGGAAAFAGYFKIDDPDDVFGNDPDVERANDPTALVRTSTNVKFLLADGDNDKEPVVQGELERFAKLVRNAQVVTGSGAHNWSFVVSHLDDLALFVNRVGTTTPSP